MSTIYSDPGEMTAREQHVWEAKYAQEFHPVVWDDEDMFAWQAIAEDAVNGANAAVNALRLVGKVLAT